MEIESPTVNWCSRDIAEKISAGEFTLRIITSSKSRAWSVFARIDDTNGQEIVGYVCCRICKKVLTFSKSQSTSNLVKHRCYVLKYLQNSESLTSIIEPEIPKLENSNSSLDYEVDNIDNNITKLITKCLIKNCWSYELINDDDFKAIFVEFVAFGAKFGTQVDIDRLLPTPKGVARNINEIYADCFKKVHTEIASIKENGFGLAMHIWSNNFLKKNYIGLTMHFLYYGAIRYRFLGLRPIYGEQCKNQNISMEIENILKDYNCKLSSKSIIVSNGSSDATKCQMLPSISDLLNAALQKSMEDIPEVVEVVNSCIKLLNYLNKMDIKIFPKKKLYSDRWTSLYEVLKLLEIHWITIETTLQIRNEEELTKNVNIDHLTVMLRIFEPFEEAFYSLENEKKATVHLVLVYLHDLKKSCDADDGVLDEFDFIGRLKKTLRSQIDKIWKENITVLHKLALFLYPPTKKLLQFTEEEKQCIETECTRLMKCFEYNLRINIKQECDPLCTSESKRRKLFLDFVESETNHDQNEFIMQELQFYKMARVVYSEDFDVFSWWEQQKDNFPLLYKLSCMIFATPASSISAQRIFTSTSNLLCNQISGLDSNDVNIEHIAFIKFNAEQDELDNKTYIT